MHDRRTLPDLAVYLVLDPGLCGGRAGMIATARAAVAGGVRIVQLREKQATTAERAETAHLIVAALAGTGAKLIVNDDLEAACAAGAHGVHMGQGDGAPADARARLGPQAILGLSVETEAAARAADPRLVDYVGAGPVFATPTKPDHDIPVGWSGLTRLTRAARVPAVAIGGLKTDHARYVRAAGAAGMAVVSAICGQPDPEAAAHALRAAWERAR